MNLTAMAKIIRRRWAFVSIIITVCVVALYSAITNYQFSRIEVDFEHSSGLYGKSVIASVVNEGKPSGTLVLISAGGASPKDYYTFAKMLNIASVHIIGHQNLDTSTSVQARILQKILRKIDNNYILHDQFSSPRLAWGTDMFWDLHNTLYTAAIDHILMSTPPNQNFVVIGHSHGASVRVLDHIFANTKVLPRAIYVMPCFDPRFIGEQQFDTLIIKGEKDEDSCSNQFQSSDAIVIPNLTHYSFLDRGFLHANAGYSKHGIDFPGLFPKNDPDHAHVVAREVNKFLEML